MNMRFLAFVALALLLGSSVIAQDRSAYIVPGEGPSSAIDIKGRHYSGSDYPGKAIPPWWQDRISAVAPEYPFDDRARHHQGKGLFKASLDRRPEP